MGLLQWFNKKSTERKKEYNEGEQVGQEVLPEIN